MRGTFCGPSAPTVQRAAELLKTRKEDKKRTIKTNLKAGGDGFNLNQSGLAVKSKVKAGGRDLNHNQTSLIS